MFSSGIDPLSLDNVTHVIQVALTPIFLLSGIAALLNVFSTRLGRVADRVDQLATKLQNNTMPETTDLSYDFAHLRRRSFILDVAVVLGSMGGVATCGSALALFVGALRNTFAASVLFSLFGFALICTIAALAAFAVEMMMASQGVRATVRKQQQTPST
jgi:hypothetical protein